MFHHFFPTDDIMNRTALLLLGALLALPAVAHDIWLDRDKGGYLLHQGHRTAAHAGAEALPYDPAIVRTALCIDAGGAARTLSPGKAYPARFSGECAALLVSLSSGYWSKTPWETRNVPKTQAPGAIRSWLSEESVKRIDRWSAALAQPLGDTLEITPTVDPLALRPDDKITVLVTENRKPRAGVAVAYDGATRGATGPDGRVAIRIRHGGTQLIAASLETPLDDGKADSRVVAATLQFELPR